MNFNVAIDKWMPVLDINGNDIIVSLLEVFQRDDLKCFSGSAVQNYSLMRLCEAVIYNHEDNRPFDRGEWKDLRYEFAKNTVEYITKNVDEFWMEGDRPFLQAPRDKVIELAKKSGHNGNPGRVKLNSSDYSGNNSVIRNSHIKEYTSYSRVALDLLSYMVFGVKGAVSKGPVGGKCQSANPTTQWESLEGKKPIIRKHGNLNIYVLADNLHDSLWLNITCDRQQKKQMWTYANTDNDEILHGSIPMWVQVSVAYDENKNKFNMIQYDGNVLRFPANCVNHMSPSSYQLDKNTKESRPARVENGYRLWKYFGNIMIKGGRPTQLDNAMHSGISTIKVRALGYVTEPTFFSDDIVESVDFSYELSRPTKMDESDYKEFYDKCTELTTSRYEALRVKAKKAGIKDIEAIHEVYWKFLDENSSFLFASEASEDSYAQWEKTVHEATNNVYDHVAKKYGYRHAECMRREHK